MAERSLEVVLEGPWTLQDLVTRPLFERQGPWSQSIDEVLLQVALAARPPVPLGFELADTWAWSRYRWAFELGEDLRLRSQWSSVPASEKRVLSDEVAAGIASTFLEANLGMCAYGDASVVLESLGVGDPGPKAGRFICLLQDGRRAVISIRGGQTTRLAVSRAAATLVARPRAKTQDSTDLGGAFALCFGVYIPPWASQEQAAVLIREDPKNPISKGALAAADPALVPGAVAQVFLAKHLALVGLPELAGGVTQQPVAEPRPLALDLRQRVERSLSQGALSGGSVQVGPRLVAGSPESTLRCSFSWSREVLGNLLQASNLRDFYVELAERCLAQDWQRGRHGPRTRLRTPLGLELSLRCGGFAAEPHGGAAGS